jgi:hypothetical protein
VSAGRDQIIARMGTPWGLVRRRLYKKTPDPARIGRR